MLLLWAYWSGPPVSNRRDDPGGEKPGGEMWSLIRKRSRPSINGENTNLCIFIHSVYLYSIEYIYIYIQYIHFAYLMMGIILIHLLFQGIIASEKHELQQLQRWAEARNSITGTAHPAGALDEWGNQESSAQ